MFSQYCVHFAHGLHITIQTWGTHREIHNTSFLITPRRLNLALEEEERRAAHGGKIQKDEGSKEERENVEDI
jgi:hypothetical protein